MPSCIYLLIISSKNYEMLTQVA